MFNVGDKVRVVVKDDVWHKYYNQIGTIVNTFCFGDISCIKVKFDDGKSIIWDVEDLELVKEKLFIKIKYFTPECHIEKIKIGDFIDLRSAIDIEYKAGEFHLIPLGVAMELPQGYEAHVVPRSSTFKHFGIIQTNSIGIIDESYAGDNDQWFFPAYALRDGKINKGDRICQFRIIRKMEPIEFIEVETLGNIDRGGHGSTGVK